ncbi:MAG: polyprenol monophosphomannose synthase [Vulcanisaeta sp.]
MDACVVLPTVNEAENLKVLLPMLRNALTNYDWFITVVDDGSTDGTQDVVNDFAKSTGRAVLIERGARLGLGSAIKVGMRFCLERGANIIVVMDADLQHPPEVVPKLIDAVANGADLAIASRYVHGGGIVGWSLKRLLISKGATYMARLLMPWVRSIRDPISGFFAINAGKLRDIIDLLSDFSGYKLILELLTVMRAKYGDGYSVVEVPYVFRGRAYGESKLGRSELIGYAMLVLRLSNYSVFKYLVSLVLGSLIGYLSFIALPKFNPFIVNLFSIELSLLTAITLYLLLMGMRLSPRHYLKYHLVKYSAVALKLAFFAMSMPIVVVLLISGIVQLLLTLRFIPVNSIVVHTI